MTSNLKAARAVTSPESASPTKAYVWVWAPGATVPVPAGVLSVRGDITVFRYGRSYQQRPEAIPLYLPELALQNETIEPLPGLTVASCIRDAGPDSWGQRVILARRLSHLDTSSDTGDLSLLTYFLESGSDRIGALDFQTSPTEYKARAHSEATLDELLNAADRLQAGEALSPELEMALLRGTSIGGARPKAMLNDTDTKGIPRPLIAKFSTTTDTFHVVKAEAVAMDLARRVGLNVANTELIQVHGRDVLLVERFDRPGTTGSAPGQLGERRIIVSALTMLGLDERLGHYATYPALADVIRMRFTDPDATLRELFSRIVFNICVSNTDDHARNHSAFWDGTNLQLTPAYDISPQARTGATANQAMAIHSDGRKASRFSICLEAADTYHLTRTQAQDIIDHQWTIINKEWPDVADKAHLTSLERNAMLGRLILNPAAKYDDAS
jgi:serine/threonine-protein kinase HipA